MTDDTPLEKLYLAEIFVLTSAAGSDNNALRTAVWSRPFCRDEFQWVLAYMCIYIPGDRALTVVYLETYSPAGSAARPVAAYEGRRRGSAVLRMRHNCRGCESC